MGLFGGNSNNSDNIIITTADIKRDYDILDIIVSKEIALDERSNYDAGKRSLKQRAAEIGADAVIGVHCFFSNTVMNGTRRWYGTAVKFK